VTSNSGKSWKKADELVGTMAVGAGEAATGWPALARVAMAFKPDPSPLQRVSFPVAAAAAQPICPVTAGGIASGASGKAIWLWDGNEVHISTDRRTTWQARQASVE
jgi:hypothetical protein